MLILHLLIGYYHLLLLLGLINILSNFFDVRFNTGGIISLTLFCTLFNISGQLALFCVIQLWFTILVINLFQVSIIFLSITETITLHLFLMGSIYSTAWRKLNYPRFFKMFDYYFNIMLFYIQSNLMNIIQHQQHSKNFDFYNHIGKWQNCAVQGEVFWCWFFFKRKQFASKIQNSGS